MSDALGEAELPPELRGKTPAEQAKRVDFLRAARQQVRAQISDLSEMRAQYLRDQRDGARGPRDAFDAEVIESIRAEAEARGIAYGGE